MVPLDDTPNIAELFGEMSHSLYRELGHSRVLLVEGKTDVKTFQALLRIFDINDHEFVILPLGGGDLSAKNVGEELSYFARLADQIWAIVDSERDMKSAPLPSAIEDFRKQCDDLKVIKPLVLERRAIENYLSDRAIKVVKGEKYRSLAPYEPLRDADPAWAKRENWRIAKEMTCEELEGTDLGEFLEEIEKASR